jgi:hypothetical protein
VAEEPRGAQVAGSRSTHRRGRQSTEVRTTCCAEIKAALVAEIALEVLRTRKRIIAALDDRLDEVLASNQQASIVRSLPGMGTFSSRPSFSPRWVR